MENEIPISVMQKVFELICISSRDVTVYPGEYVLVWDRSTQEKVRVYMDGSVWKTNQQTGAYELEK